MNGQQYDLVPAHLAVRAFRDNGYKTTAHAIAELMDNAAQADAGLIELFAVEEPHSTGAQTRHRVTEIAVLDNGDGMDEQTLRIALQFGNGTHLEDRSGIGRFGMGLPNSSISQCRRVDVWTWQAGPDNAIHSYIDLEEVERGELREVPEPQPSPVPTQWRELGSGFGPSGTLVVWSELDRVNWRGAAATLRNTEMVIGRMYRKLIHNRGLVIRLVAVRAGKSEWETFARPNDPLYLMAPSATSAPFDKKPMFRPWGTTGEEKVPIEVDGETHTVTLRFTWSTDEARLPADGTDPGHKDYGKDARRNVGVSIVRADRELDLDTSWVNNDLRERWWGVEVEFPPALDEIFGVTNNKQAATHFSELGRLYTDDPEFEKNWMELRGAWAEEGDPRLHLADVANRVWTQLQAMRTALRQQTSGRRAKKDERHDTSGVEDRATTKWTDRVESGHDTTEDLVEVTPEEKREVLVKDLSRKGISSARAEEIASEVIDHDRKIVFIEGPSDSPAFFTPVFLPGVTEVVFNMSHPAYKQFYEVLDGDLFDGDEADLRERLILASDTLKMMLCAWARYEYEEKEGPRRERVQEVRQEWGKLAKFFLSDDGVSGS